MESLAFGNTQSRLLDQLKACGLSESTTSSLLGRHTTVRYGKGSPLFLRGAPADVLFVVLSGMVKVCWPGTDGGRILVELAAPGDIVGYADFLDERSHRCQLFEAEALTNCSVALLTREHVHKALAGEPPAILLKVVELMNSSWSGALERYAAFLSMSLKQRLILVLKELSSRFGVNDARGVMLTVELSQEELAETIGSSRPMISKIIAELTAHGQLARQGRRYILPHKPAAANGKPRPARDADSAGVPARMRAGAGPNGSARAAAHA